MTSQSPSRTPRSRALYQALDSLGFDDLRMEEKTKLLSGYDGKKLAQQVRKSTQAVTPYQLQALVRMQFVQQAAHHAVIRRVAEVARQNGIHPFRTREDLLSDERIDFVVVATPNNYHCEIAIDAMAHGKHVIS